MRQNQIFQTAFLFFFLMGGVLSIESKQLFAQKESIESQKKAVSEKEKKEAEAEAERVERERTKQRQLEAIRDQQKQILDTQKTLLETFERSRFLDLTAKLDKPVYQVGERITPIFFFQNGSGRPFTIDGRKLYPRVEVWDKKGTQMTIHQPYQEMKPPAKEDMIVLKQGETFTPSPTEFVIEKPGSYKMRLVYSLMAPEARMEGVWFGTINTYDLQFRVVGKKEKK